ncbi:MAG: hypothetical protein L6Q99_05205 [Planctomycetes bacterium]|nr:hypothetical protein [Planctomycetota bacterium]
MTLRVSGIRFFPAPVDLQATGLVGWTSFLVNDALRLDGVGVRRAADGRHTLAYPVREDASGREHYAVRPIDSRTRRALERQVLGHLGFEPAEAR